MTRDFRTSHDDDEATSRRARSRPRDGSLGASARRRRARVRATDRPRVRNGRRRRDDAYVSTRVAVSRACEITLAFGMRSMRIVSTRGEGRRGAECRLFVDARRDARARGTGPKDAIRCVSARGRATRRTNCV